MFPGCLRANVFCWVFLEGVGNSKGKVFIKVKATSFSKKMTDLKCCSLRISVQLKYEVTRCDWGLLGLEGKRPRESTASPTYTPNVSGFRWVHGGTQLCFFFVCWSPCIEPSFEIQMAKLWTGGAGPVEK